MMLKLKKSEFVSSKDSTDINEVASRNILISEISYGRKGFKYFIGYKDDTKFNLLCIMLSKTCEYVKWFQISDIFY